MRDGMAGGRRGWNGKMRNDLGRDNNNNDDVNIKRRVYRV